MNLQEQQQAAQAEFLKLPTEEQQKAVANFMKTAINSIAGTIHEQNRKVGWWTNPDGSAVQDNPLTFSSKIALCHSELSEALEGDRKNLMDDHLTSRPMREVELADTIIRIFDLAAAYQLDIGGAVVDKLIYNASRADHKRENREQAGGKSY